MIDLNTDPRAILTLDAGGTNFDFSALKNGKEAVEQLRFPANGNDLQKCIDTIKEGFSALITNLDEKPAAISFAFPGPADYKQGIIGDLGNLPAFRGGVPLKAILEREFKIPVFINNDANLFVYGEALLGFLPKVNQLLEDVGNPKRYNNLIGVTLGTGFGGGFVSNGQLLTGDNSLGGEIWLTSSRMFPNINADEAFGKRALKRAYAAYSGTDLKDAPEPLFIAKIAMRETDGDTNAAVAAFNDLGSNLGDVLANLITLYDGLVVIGGGVAHSHHLFFPALFKQLDRRFENKGGAVNRLVQKVYNLEDPDEKEAFLKPAHKPISWPGFDTMSYEPTPNLAIGVTETGTRKATSLGAYAYALSNL